MTGTNRRWIYAHPVKGPISPANFELREDPIQQITFGQTLVRVRRVSIDPTNRNWILRPGYLPQVMPGDVMSAFGIGEILETSDPYRFKVGDIVHGNLGWQEYAVLNSFDRQEYVHVCASGSLEEQIGLFGVTGLTAYFGLRRIGPARAGETIVVAGTTGACGSVLAQLAKAKGYRVVGTAGGAEKCAWVRANIGVDAVVDYHDTDLPAALCAACPGGIDMFSDGVGGAVADAVYPLLNDGARVLDYGRISAYNMRTVTDFAKMQPPPPRSAALNAVLASRGVRFERLLVFDSYGERLAAQAELAALQASGRLKAFSTVVNGLLQLPDTLVGVFANDVPRYGKLSVSV
jgi:NADPH-dependent curcumin reductase CurA